MTERDPLSAGIPVPVTDEDITDPAASVAVPDAEAGTYAVDAAVAAGSAAVVVAAAIAVAVAVMDVAGVVVGIAVSVGWRKVIVCEQMFSVPESLL